MFDAFDEMADLRGLIDVALLPISGWGPRLGAGHLDPQRAAQAARIIAPGVAIPIHWGTYLPYGSRRKDLLVSPPVQFSARAAELSPSTRVEVLSPGGAFVCKVLQGGTEREVLERLKRTFTIVKHVKPPASRAGSAELYVVATGFRVR